MTKPSFLWEVGCEEIPASWLPSLLEQFRDKFEEELAEAGLPDTQVVSSGTLRRLVVHVDKLSRKQEDRTEQVKGPPLRIATDESGHWSEAALGFAKKNGIDTKALSVLTTPKGDYVGKDSVELEMVDHEIGSGPDDPGKTTKTRSWRELFAA